MSSWCPVCSGTGKCPICGNYRENRFKELARVRLGIEKELYDLTHESGKHGVKKIPKFVLASSVDKIRHISSLKSILADIEEITRDL